MLDDRTLARMDADELRQYVTTLHQALGHVLDAAGTAYGHVQRSRERSSGGPGDKYIELARALTGGTK